MRVSIIWLHCTLASKFLNVCERTKEWGVGKNSKFRKILTILIMISTHYKKPPTRREIGMHELSSDSEDEPVISLRTKTVVENRLGRITDNDFISSQRWKIQEDKCPILAKLFGKCLASPVITLSLVNVCFLYLDTLLIFFNSLKR